jgi:uncharacterized protein
MHMTEPIESKRSEGFTVVITNRVRPGQEAAYDAWLNEIGPISRQAPGSLDWQIIRPVPGVTSTYTVVLRFDTREHLEAWIGSEQRRRLIDKVRPLLEHEDKPSIHSGLDFWFVPDSAQAGVAVRWKQFLVTWSAIFPLVLLVPLVVLPPLHAWGLPANRYLETLLTSGIIVWLMAYLVMPRYTRLLRHWLYR